MARSKIPSGTKVYLPYPHQGQIRVRQEAKRHNVLVAGRRWRKTTLAMAVSVEAAIQGYSVVWGSPTYSQTMVGFEESRKAASDVANFIQSRLIADFNSGGRISFKSLDDPESSRGLTADGVVIDEAGDVKEQAYYDVLRPMLMDTGGWSWLIGTPRGLNWFYNEFNRAGEREDSVAWQIPSYGCSITEDGELVRREHPYENPDLYFEEILSLFETMTERSFRQEILAEFLEGAGSVFRNLANTLIYAEDTPDNHVGHLIVQGIDWGRINDFTVISSYCVTCNREVDIQRFNQISYPYQIEKILIGAGEWNPVLIIGEVNAIGLPLMEQLEQYNLPLEGFQTTLNSKEMIVQRLALSLEKTQSFWLNHPQGNEEMKAYEIKLTQTGRAQYSAPNRGHDDIVIARCLAWLAAQQYLHIEGSVPSSTVLTTDEMIRAFLSPEPAQRALPDLSSVDIVGEDLDGAFHRLQQYQRIAPGRLAPSIAKEIMDLQQKVKEREREPV